MAMLGGPDEEPLAGQVQATLGGRAINLARKTSLGALAAAIERLDLLVANDSGPAHLASALRVPSVLVFGPANLKRWAPLDQARHRVVHRGVECSPCTHWECPIDHRCLAWIGADEVYAAAAAQLRAHFPELSCAG